MTGKRLEDVVVGDIVLYSSREHDALKKVTRRTTTKIIIEFRGVEHVFNLRGQKTGKRDPWNHVSISIPTEAEVEKIRERGYRERALKTIRDGIGSVRPEVLYQIEALVQNDLDDPTDEAIYGDLK